MLVLTLLPLGHGSPSVGTSQHNPDEMIFVGEPKKFSVGIIYNTGDVTLNITAGWHQEFGSMALSIIVTPEIKIVQPGEFYVIYMTVDATKVGYYNGTVQFTGTTLTTEHGSPIRPSGSLPAQITIIEKSVEPTQPQSETSWLLYACLCIGIGFVVASLAYLVRFRRRI